MYYKNERETCNHFVMNRNINLKISNSTRIHLIIAQTKEIDYSNSTIYFPSYSPHISIIFHWIYII